MVVAYLVLLVSSAVFLVGAVATLVDALRAPRGGGRFGSGRRGRRGRGARHGPVLGGSAWQPSPSWGLPLIRGASVDTGDLWLVVVVLGCGGDRAGYLARTRAAAERRGVWTAATTVAMVAAGPAVGSTV